MSTDFAGRTAFVTGGSRGLGQALVDELLTRGARRVYVAARSAHTHPDPRVVPIVMDVTDPDQITAAAAQADDVDLLVNNAGTFSPGPILAADETALRRDLETNLFGLLNVTRAFAPTLAAHESSAILNVLSVVSWFSAFGGYGVSKAAALSATDAIRLETAEQGITVTALHVGFMETDMVKDLDVPKSNPADIARVALDGVNAGDLEVLADETAVRIKSQLSGPVAALYPALAAA